MSKSVKSISTKFLISTVPFPITLINESPQATFTELIPEFWICVATSSMIFSPFSTKISPVSGSEIVS